MTHEMVWRVFTLPLHGPRPGAKRTKFTMFTKEGYEEDGGRPAAGQPEA